MFCSHLFISHLYALLYVHILVVLHISPLFIIYISLTPFSPPIITHSSPYSSLGFVEEFFDIGLDHDTTFNYPPSNPDFHDYFQGPGLGPGIAFPHGVTGGPAVGILDGCQSSDEVDDILCRGTRSGNGKGDEDPEISDQQDIKPPMDKKEG